LDDLRFKIAEAARMTGVSASTLRLWETQGLIDPIRTPSGQRLYDRVLVDRLKMIVWLRSEEGLNPAAIRQRLTEQMPATQPDSFERVDDDDDAMPDASFGWKLRRLRRDAGMTLETVAQAAGISTSLLSTFERTSQGLSLTALHAVTKHLGTTITVLSGEQNDTPGESLIRDGQWTTWPASSSGVTVQALAEGRNQMECHRFLLAPGASSEGAYQHDGEEFIHVLKGALEIVLDGDRFFKLQTGDSFYFESRRPHSWRNTSEAETILIWINTPPTF
jgi:DNA-binding transcriptional MerR regulator/quercetin dioxygenase-like cupin family protein